MKQSKQECVRTQTTVRLRDSPAKDLLSETLERLFRKWLSENVSELFLGVNPLDLNVLGEMRPEPVDLDIVKLRPGSGLARIQVGKGFSHSVVFPTCHFESGQMFIWDSNSFGHSHGQIPHGQDIPYSIGQGIIFSHHRAECSGILELGRPDYWTVIDADDEPSPGLDRDRIIPRFLSMQRQKVSINMAVHEEPVKLGRLQNHPLLTGPFQVLSYSDEG